MIGSGKHAFLAEIPSEATWGAAGECLVLYIPKGSVAESDLIDPELIGDLPGRGHWRLLHFEQPEQIGYYTRVDPADLSQKIPLRQSLN